MQIVQLLKSYSVGRRDFSGVDFREAWMPGLQLNQAVLQGADLTGSNLSHSSLWEVDFFSGDALASQSQSCPTASSLLCEGHFDSVSARQ